MKITTIGIDLAKEVFQIHGVDVHGKAVLRKQLRRSDMTKFFVNLEPCLIGMEACGSSHHWARKLGEFGIVIPQGSDPSTSVCRIFWKMPRMVCQVRCASCWKD